MLTANAKTINNILSIVNPKVFFKRLISILAHSVDLLLSKIFKFTLKHIERSTMVSLILYLRKYY